MWSEDRCIGSSDYEKYISHLDIKDWEEIPEDKYYSLIALLAKRPSQYGERVVLFREPKPQEVDLPKCIDELIEQQKKLEQKRKKEEKEYKEKKRIAKEKRELKAYQKLQEKFQNSHEST